MKCFLFSLFIIPIVLFGDDDRVKGKYCIIPEARRLVIGMTTGSAFNVAANTTISQAGFPDINLKAKWATEAFKMPIYWDLLAEYSERRFQVGVHFMHHKLVLTNEHALLEKISITHGYNIFNLYGGYRFLANSKHYSFYGLIGVGVAFSHPEGKVRGQNISRLEGVPLLSGNYDMSYPNFELAIHKDWMLNKKLAVRSAFKTTYFNGKIETRNGYIDLNTLSFHVNLGLSYQIQ
jgi:hypothetical protein